MVRGGIAEAATMRGALEAGGPEHVPVLVREVVEHLRPALELRPEGPILDGTLGLAGHASALLEAFPRARLVGVDQDPEALALAAATLAPFGDRARVVRGRASELARLAAELGLEATAAVLLDLGVSSLQLDRAERGFSFQHDGPLDMRMDPTRERSAADIVNRWDEQDLADLLYHEGGETRARVIARAIVASRRQAPFLRTLGLAEVVARAVGRSGGKIHPATRTFQALRRAVNEEGEELRAGLEAAEALLAEGGRIAVISFHSGEDREVKRFLAEGAREGRWKIVTKKPLEAGDAERRTNPRSRSARLRVAVRATAPARGAVPVEESVRRVERPERASRASLRLHSLSEGRVRTLAFGHALAYRRSR